MKAKQNKKLSFEPINEMMMMLRMMCNEARKRYRADDVKTIAVYVRCEVGCMFYLLPITELYLSASYWTDVASDFYERKQSLLSDMKKFFLAPKLVSRIF